MQKAKEMGKQDEDLIQEYLEVHIPEGRYHNIVIKGGQVFGVWTDWAGLLRGFETIGDAAQILAEARRWSKTGKENIYDAA